LIIVGADCVQDGVHLVTPAEDLTSTKQKTKYLLTTSAAFRPNAAVAHLVSTAGVFTKYRQNSCVQLPLQSFF